MSVPDLHIEIEIKLKLSSEADYLKLVGFLKPFDLQQNQTNLFFDSETRQLSAAKWALRVRVDDTSGLITLKGRSDDHGGASVREEIESTIDRSIANKIISGTINLLDLEDPLVEEVKTRFGISSLVQVLKFSNMRQNKTIEFDRTSITVELDKSEFAGGVIEYEVEVEVGSVEEVEAAQSAIDSLLKKLEIPVIRQSKSKFERALYHAAKS